MVTIRGCTWLAFLGVLVSCALSVSCSSSSGERDGWPRYAAVYSIEEGTGDHTRVKIIKLTYDGSDGWREDTIADSETPSTAGSWSEYRAPELTQYLADQERTATQVAAPGESIFPITPWGYPIASAEALLRLGWERKDGAHDIEKVVEYELLCEPTRPAFECPSANAGTVKGVERFVRDSHGIPIEYTDTVAGRLVRHVHAVLVDVRD